MGKIKISRINKTRGKKNKCQTPNKQQKEKQNYAQQRKVKNEDNNDTKLTKGLLEN